MAQTHLKLFLNSGQKKAVKPEPEKSLSRIFLKLRCSLFWKEKSVYEELHLNKNSPENVVPDVLYKGRAWVEG